ncbi:nucleoside deaminase [Aeromicrobium yanjiei]|uniref:Nucleoside deaminase n=1 Tax=Aeromicrobium yanjiei TaxID=2662028 RepID=A0A5Q2MID5_9ACTN|nr:nucleoside deaminase [Aeromicrobium yanjiei]QGG41521.1 nucleoside deaminase [Aeromicrobium yanjiei]
MKLTPDDEGFLRAAITLAADSRAAGDAPFGSLLVDRHGAVIAQDHNTVTSERDITAHPELKLARWAARELTASEAGATTMYTSCEPCSMCTGAIDRAGLARVVFALPAAALDSIKRPGEVPTVPRVGPGLVQEAVLVVQGYY